MGVEGGSFGQNHSCFDLLYKTIQHLSPIPVLFVSLVPMILWPKDTKECLCTKVDCTKHFINKDDVQKETFFLFCYNDYFRKDLDTI